jgi:hypothetical protein
MLSAKGSSAFKERQFWKNREAQATAETCGQGC